MLFLPCLSRSPLCSISFGTTNLCVEPHPLVSLLQDQLSFLSVCAVANLPASRLGVSPFPGFALRKGVALSALAAALFVRQSRYYARHSPLGKHRVGNCVFYKPKTISY